MAILKGNSTSATYSLVEADVYESRITRMVMVGAQKQQAYQGKEKADAVVMKCSFELIGNTVTLTKADESKEIPAILFKDINLVKGGITRGGAFDLISATIGGKETYHDSTEYGSLLNSPLNVKVVQAKSNAGEMKNYLNELSSMNKKYSDALESATTDLLFFDCYEDSEEMKTAYTKIGQYNQGLLAKASDGAAIPAIAQGWAVDAPSEEDAKDEF